MNFIAKHVRVYIYIYYDWWRALEPVVVIAAIAANWSQVAPGENSYTVTEWMQAINKINSSCNIIYIDFAFGLDCFHFGLVLLMQLWFNPQKVGNILNKMMCGWLRWPHANRNWLNNLSTTDLPVFMNSNASTTQFQCAR